MFRKMNLGALALGALITPSEVRAIDLAIAALILSMFSMSRAATPAVCDRWGLDGQAAQDKEGEGRISSSGASRQHP